MKTYFKCSICDGFEEVGNVRHVDEEKEKPVCLSCFYNHQDNLAFVESDGEFTNYENWMESKGATICDWDIPKREY